MCPFFYADKLLINENIHIKKLRIKKKQIKNNFWMTSSLERRERKETEKIRFCCCFFAFALTIIDDNFFQLFYGNFKLKNNLTLSSKHSFLLAERKKCRKIQKMTSSNRLTVAPPIKNQKSKITHLV